MAPELHSLVFLLGARSQVRRPLLDAWIRDLLCSLIHGRQQPFHGHQQPFHGQHPLLLGHTIGWPWRPGLPAPFLHCICLPLLFPLEVLRHSSDPSSPLHCSSCHLCFSPWPARALAVFLPAASPLGFLSAVESAGTCSTYCSSSDTLRCAAPVGSGHSPSICAALESRRQKSLVSPSLVSHCFWISSA
ncbi:hypothetical protein Zm00014a_017909 [Zea mays]|uniref:Uncharacterized protein n=1 Tax=Zea mays TaxID=4577 RepID=A0A3L6DFL5_MAIZE|nr:hypothetical protein Zm00014a_017909 [Zea mays]